MPLQRQHETYRILLADDNQEILEDYRKILRPENHHGQLHALAQAFFSPADQAAPDSPGDPEKPAAPARPRYAIDTASQGPEAVEMIRRAVEAGRPYALAIVDMRMPPGYGGLETIERAWALDPDLQTVICSAYSDYSHADILERLGDSDRLLILRKPFDTIEVSQIASALTAKWDASRQVRCHLESLEDKIRQRTDALEKANLNLREAVRKRTEAETRMRRAALHDALTDLPNRTLLIDRLERFAERCQPLPSATYGVLFMDLDNFKVVNDGLGHPVGDRLLIGVAQRLLQAVHRIEHELEIREATVSRLGGDEFIVGLDGVADHDQAQRAADILRAALGTPVRLDERDLYVETSIGIALAQESSDTPESIIRDADTALYLAKSRGKDQTAVFDAEMREMAEQRLTLENDLRRAFEVGELTLAYQPIVSLESGDIVSAEALLRWDHPAEGTIPPQQFVPIAEETALINNIGQWVLEEACLQAVSWARYPTPRPLSVCVNVSPKQVLSGDLTEGVRTALERSGLGADRLRIEITEGLLLRDAVVVRDTFDELREMGVSLVLDDFGTGHSSLSHLHQIPVDGIKLDRSFVQQLAEDGVYTNSVQALITLAANRQMSVVAEGIETLTQLVQLQTLDCAYGQGFYFSRPANAYEFERLLLGGACWRYSA